MIIGLLMGDGHVADNNGSSYFDLSMSNREFLEWFDNELGVMSTGVKLGKSGDYIERSAISNGFVDSGEYDFSDSYRVWTRTHPFFTKLRDRFYTDSKKQFPGDLEITPTILKFWYVSDGHIENRDDSADRVFITSTNEADRPVYIVDLFRDAPIEPTVSSNKIYFSVDDTNVFFGWIGKPPVGFEYKWTESFLSG